MMFFMGGLLSGRFAPYFVVSMNKLTWKRISYVPVQETQRMVLSSPVNMGIFELHVTHWNDNLNKLNLKNTYETSFASLAGPISDRVVKPVALQVKPRSSLMLYFRPTFLPRCYVNSQYENNLPPAYTGDISQRRWYTDKVFFLFVYQRTWRRRCGHRHFFVIIITTLSSSASVLYYYYCTVNYVPPSVELAKCLYDVCFYVVF